MVCPQQLTDHLVNMEKVLGEENMGTGRTGRLVFELWDSEVM